MAKSRTNQHPIGRTARPRQITRRGERRASSHQSQSSALPEDSLSRHAQRSNVSPSATTESPAESSPSSDFHTSLSGKRKNAPAKSHKELSSDLQQHDERVAIDSHSPSDSVTLSTHWQLFPERPDALVPWREPSPEEYRSIYDNADAPSPAQQPSSYQPYHLSEFEAQGLLRDVADPRQGPSNTPSPMPFWESSEGHLIREARTSEPRLTGVVHNLSGLSDDKMVCNWDRTQLENILKSSVQRVSWLFLLISYLPSCLLGQQRRKLRFYDTLYCLE